jgi:hypothetical protein
MKEAKEGKNKVAPVPTDMPQPVKKAKEGKKKPTLVPTHKSGGSKESDSTTANKISKKKGRKEPKVESKKRPALELENKPVTKREKTSKQQQKTIVSVLEPSKVLPVAPEPVIEKPKHVETPEFQYIEISHPIPVIHNRM